MRLKRNKERARTNNRGEAAGVSLNRWPLVARQHLREMKLWKRATGAIKDKRSILVAKLSPHSPIRSPDLEAVIIKATSHDEHRIDFKNVQRVIQSAGTSPVCLKPIVWSLSRRMEKTQSWAVALKGLMLMHGIFCCEIPMLQNVERLPFDLSNFSEGYLKPDKAWGYNAFIRAYFAYLEQRSAFSSSEYIKKSKQSKEIEDSLMEELKKLQKMQSLIDAILQIRPQNEHTNDVGLILEALDCIIVEVFDLYGKFRKGIARILLRINDMGGKVEASIGLKVLQKAAIQGDELSWYFELCKEIGVVNASQCPSVERISEENIQNLQRIANGDYDKIKGLQDIDEEKAIVVRDCSANEQKLSKNGSKTVITEKWEVFEDDLLVDFRDYASDGGKVIVTTNPFEDSYSLVPYSPAYNRVLPDLISF